MITWADANGAAAGVPASYSRDLTYSGSTDYGTASATGHYGVTTTGQGDPGAWEGTSETAGESQTYVPSPPDTNIHDAISSGFTGYTVNGPAGATTETSYTAETVGGSAPTTSSGSGSTTTTWTPTTTETVGTQGTTTDTTEASSTYTTETWEADGAIHTTSTTTRQTFDSTGGFITETIARTTWTTGLVTNEIYSYQSYASTFVTLTAGTITVDLGPRANRSFWLPEGCNQLFLGTLGADFGVSASCEIFTKISSHSYEEALTLSSSSSEDIGADYAAHTYAEFYVNADASLTGSLPYSAYPDAVTGEVIDRDAGFMHYLSVSNGDPIYSSYTISCPASISELLSTSSNRRTQGELHWKGPIAQVLPWEPADTMAMGGAGGATSRVTWEAAGGTFSNLYTEPLTVNVPVGVFDITTINQANVTASARETFSSPTSFLVSSDEMIALTPIPSATAFSSYGEMFKFYEQSCTFPQPFIPS